MHLLNSKLTTHFRVSSASFSCCDIAVILFSDLISQLGSVYSPAKVYNIQVSSEITNVSCCTTLAIMLAGLWQVWCNTLMKTPPTKQIVLCLRSGHNY